MKVVTVIAQCCRRSSLLGLVHDHYSYVTLHTSGWKTGARNRTRNFKTFCMALTYVNKLHDGGWLSDDNYDLAYRMIDGLRQEIAEARTVRGYALLDLGDLFKV